MAFSDKTIESYKNTITTAASLAASVMLVRSVVNEVVPYELRDMLLSGFSFLRSNMSSQHTIIIEKKNDAFTNNHVYNAVKAYLATRINPDIQQRLRVSSMDENDKMMVSMAEGDEMTDVYDGMEFKWSLICHENSSDSGNNGIVSQQEASCFEVSFHKKHKEKALKSYLPFILATAKDIKNQERTLRIYMTEYSDWSPIDLHHPSTFDTLAMDQKLKQSIIDDLNRFTKRKDYYKRIGKAWKRGYLLYGPPGTGKSSLIAAMANHLRFDIYDLELTAVNSNSDLRRLLVGMSNRSILVVEDIDCSIELKQREEGEGREKSIEDKGEDKVTLSGLLNFVDGLWSTSGEERIIVFTTNYKNRLDPALLRPGRMDMHIHMGYCTPESFRILANNYHSIDYHNTYPEIEELMKEAMVTPAEVAEVLMRDDDTDAALHDLVDFDVSLAELALEVVDDAGAGGEVRRDDNIPPTARRPRSRPPPPPPPACAPAPRRPRSSRRAGAAFAGIGAGLSRRRRVGGQRRRRRAEWRSELGNFGWRRADADADADADASVWVGRRDDSPPSLARCSLFPGSPCSRCRVGGQESIGPRVIRMWATLTKGRTIYVVH